MASDLRSSSANFIHVLDILFREALILTDVEGNALSKMFLNLNELGMRLFLRIVFGTKITEIIFKGNTKYFRDGAFRMKLCLYMLMEQESS